MDENSWGLFLADFIAGWVGGVTGLLIGHPADTIKVQQQTFGVSFRKSAIKTFQYEGIPGFYKGMLGPFLTIGPSNAIFFGGYGICIRYLQSDDPLSEGRLNLNNPNWRIYSLIAGGFAGFIQVIATCPIELVKTSMQSSTPKGVDEIQSHRTHHYNNSLQAAREIYGLRGIRGLFKGFVPMACRDVPASAVYTLVYEELLPRGKDQAMMKQIIAGGIAGVCSWLISLPFDVVKSRIQSDDVRKPEYKGMIHCFSKSYKTQGLTVFAKGFWIIVFRAFPVNAAIFYSYEECSELLRKIFS